MKHVKFPPIPPGTATVGVLTETNADRAIEELKAYEADVATVLREGRWTVTPAVEIVPGDIVEVAVGGKVPADVRVAAILSSGLRIDQVRLPFTSAWAQLDAGLGDWGVGLSHRNERLDTLSCGTRRPTVWRRPPVQH